MTYFPNFYVIDSKSGGNRGIPLNIPFLASQLPCLHSMGFPDTDFYYVLRLTHAYETSGSSRVKNPVVLLWNLKLLTFNFDIIPSSAAMGCNSMFSSCSTCCIKSSSLLTICIRDNYNVLSDAGLFQNLKVNLIFHIFIFYQDFLNMKIYFLIIVSNYNFIFNTISYNLKLLATLIFYFKLHKLAQTLLFRVIWSFEFRFLFWILICNHLIWNKVSFNNLKFYSP